RSLLTSSLLKSFQLARVCTKTFVSVNENLRRLFPKNVSIQKKAFTTEMPRPESKSGSLAFLYVLAANKAKKHCKTLQNILSAGES
ncbi:MAG TPA: hypothetical protein VNO70_07205, partial [Blastocatellia bacterium]|nr:hypothetical protein [Blastocatellia bacterium]